MDGKYFQSIPEDALALSDPTEVFTVGLPITIAKYSFAYWKNTADSFVVLLIDQDEQRYSRESGPCRNRIGLGQIGAADVVGGVRGAVGGGLGGGPLGAVAGATVVGAGTSLWNIGSQLIGCLFSWW